MLLTEDNEGQKHETTNYGGHNLLMRREWGS